MKVSIGLIAYNHEKFIEQCLEGIFSQRTRFDFEVLVGEDCSTDRTRAILLDWQARYPERLRLLDTPHNLGMIHNYARTFQACRGEYVVLLDGDDYWCDPHKLQKQLDWMELHPEYTVTFHAVQKIYEDGSRVSKIVRPPEVKTEYSPAELLVRMFIPTCSAMLRGGVIREIPAWAYQMDVMDYPLLALAAHYGRIGFLDEVMAVYRVHSGGAWSSMAQIERLAAKIKFLERIDPHLGFAYTGAIQQHLAECWDKMSNEFYDEAVAAASLEKVLERLCGPFETISSFRSMPHNWDRRIFRRIYTYYLVRSYRGQDYSQARTSWRKLIQVDPGALRNRGLLVMGLGSALNGGPRRWLRRRAGRTKSDSGIS